MLFHLTCPVRARRTLALSSHLWRDRPGQHYPEPRRSLRVEALEDRAVPTVSWSNAAGGDWDSPANWSSGIVPGPADDVVIQLAGSATVTHSQNVADSVNSVMLHGNVTLSAGLLHIATTLSNSGTLTLSGSGPLADVDTVLNSGSVLVATSATLAATHFIQSGGRTTLQGGTLGAQLPPEGTALSFDGVQDSVQVPSTPGLNPTGAITVEAWVQPGPLNSPLEGIAGTWNDLSGNTRSYLLWLQLGKVAFYVSHDGQNFPNVVSTTTLQTGRWYHVAGTFDGGNLAVYIDGVREAAGVSPGPIATNTQPFRIGDVTAGGSTPRFFNGQMADVRLWNVARSANDLCSSLGQKLFGSEPGLAGNWTLDDGSGNTALDQSPAHANGTLSAPPPVWGTVPVGTVTVQGGTLAGSGTINADLSNSGVVDLGGLLTVKGAYNQTGTGVLHVPVDGNSGRLVVAGAASLAGTLNITLEGGFLPRAGQTFSVLSAASVSGGVASVSSPPCDGGPAFTTRFTPSGLQLVGATTPPTSTVLPLDPISQESFTVRWTGQDNPGGEGLAGFDVFVSVDGGPFEPFLLGTLQTQRVFTGKRGHSYGFYSVATDVEGNREDKPAVGEASTTVLAQVGTASSVSSSAAGGSTYGEMITLTATVTPDLPIFGTPTGSVQFLVDSNPIGLPLAQGNRLPECVSCPVAIERVKGNRVV